MKVVITNFSKPVRKKKFNWDTYVKPAPGERLSLFECQANWGFHIYAIGVYLMDLGIADEVEFWDFSEERSAFYLPNGILQVNFHDEDDAKSYLQVFGYPDLHIQHGSVAGHGLLRYLKEKCFTVFVPALRHHGYDFEHLLDRFGNFRASCYLVDSEDYLDDRSLLYIPVVNTKKIFPKETQKKRDFIYLARNYGKKRHDLLVNAIRRTELTGHLHPVDATTLNLENTNITTSDWDEADVLELLTTSRIAVYPGDYTSNPAAMWECVAAGLPIVVNKNIQGGKHLVVPGVTGEFASEHNFYDVMKHVLQNRESYRPREYFMENWDTVPTLDRYLAFFRKMGWKY